jgi:diketogulonate reductase-like aldo/keto reductase
MITRPFGRTGVEVSVIGQGTWRMGERAGDEPAEVAALRLGIELGMTHIDTAEMYADGGAERVVAKVIRGRRDEVFVATKVMPSNASHAGTIAACEASVKRLGTDHVDLYLVHWWSGRHPIADTMRAMRELVRRGLTRHVGVSNFDVAQMKQAQDALGDLPLACNQVLYHLGDRGIETEVLTWCRRQRVAVVGYTPLARGGYMKEAAVADAARAHGVTPRQIALNFLTREAPLFTIPKASRPEHVRENAAALDFTLTRAEIARIAGDRA